MTWKRTALYCVVAIAAIGLAAPFIGADGLRARIRAAMEQSLGRKVEIGGVSLNLFNGPGFTLKDVTIYDDPTVGIEPMAYVERMHARVRLLSLLSRRLSFSNLRMVEPSVNVVKRDDGLWNFQLLLNRTGNPKDPPTHDAPSIEIRSGRLNFKFGDAKSVYYVAEADVDLDPSPDQLDFRFRGEPARTDRAAQSFGRILFRGVWKRTPGAESELDVNAELERSAVGDLAKLIEGRGVGLHGAVASRAHIHGSISKLAIDGQLRVSDVHRWDLIPQRSDGIAVAYRGTVDLWNQRLRIETAPPEGVPLVIRFEAIDYLSKPRWNLVADFKDVPSANFLEAARHMGAPLPDALVAGGKVAGAIGISETQGLQGQLRFEDTSLHLPSSDPIRFQSADIVVNNSLVTVGPAVVQLPKDQTAEIQGAYKLDTGELKMQISTERMDIAELQSPTGRALGAGNIPIIGEMRQGALRGAVTLERTGDADSPSHWFGKLDLENGRVDVPGLAKPVRIASAVLSLDGDRISVSKMRGSAGPIVFTGEYQGAQKLRLDIRETTPEDLEDLFEPTLHRGGSLLSRTLRFSGRTLPEWLRSRRVDALVKIDRLDVNGDAWRVNRARVVWNGTAATINGIDAHREDASAMGSIRVDLTHALPAYVAQVRLEGLPFKSGSISLDGSLETDGLGTDLLAAARGQGTFTGEQVAFAPDASFDSIAGSFALSQGLRVKLAGLQISQEGDTYTGQGATQPDGRLLLELAGKKQLKLTGSLAAPPAPVSR